MTSHVNPVCRDTNLCPVTGFAEVALARASTMVGIEKRIVDLDEFAAEEMEKRMLTNLELNW